jgi:hypothetical protein
MSFKLLGKHTAGATGSGLHLVLFDTPRGIYCSTPGTSYTGSESSPAGLLMNFEIEGEMAVVGIVPRPLFLDLGFVKKKNFSSRCCFSYISMEKSNLMQ